MNAKICLAGKNKIAVDALIYLVGQGLKDRLIICPNITDSGRSNWQPSLVRFARELQVETETLEKIQEIKDLIFISLEFDRIIKPRSFKTSRLYNLHFSALPAYKGMYTSALPILHGATETGVTLHKIDSGIDTGPVLAQKRFAIHDTWTARDLYFAYMEYGFELFRNHFERLISIDEPLSEPQLPNGSSYFSKAAINYGDLSINLRDTAEGIIRQLRAFSFREYQIPCVYGLAIGGWEILRDRSQEKPSTIVEQDLDEIVIATIDFNVRLSRSRVWDWFGVDNNTAIAGFDSKHIDFADENGWTPLIRAAYSGDAELCSRLLAAGADPNRANTNGTTPLMYSLSSSNPFEASRTLLAYGADPKQKDLFGKDLNSYHGSIIEGLHL